MAIPYLYANAYLESLLKERNQDELADKVRALTAFAGTGLDAARIIEAVWGLDREPDVRQLVAAMTPAIA